MMLVNNIVAFLVILTQRHCERVKHLGLEEVEGKVKKVKKVKKVVLLLVT